MAKISGLILGLFLIVSVLAVLQGAAGQQPQKQRPRPATQAVQAVANKNKNNNRPRPHKKQPNKGQQEKEQDKKKLKLITVDVPDLGRLRGRTLQSEWTGKPILQFLDIPYGSVHQRFKPAEPTGQWKGVLQAHRHHAGCPSIQDLEKFAKLEKSGEDVEDCLRLTINTRKMEGKLSPVMVYIHGDFFYEGDSMEAAPGYLLEKDVVLVSVRYRLGPFGFLSTKSEEMPGNMAVTDIILALQWIQEHISGFGGDPKRVTLFGQVGGAALVNVLTLSPAVPAGLFHRVIYQSGSALSPAFITDSPLAATKAIATIAGCPVKKLDALHKCLNRLNTTMLLASFTVHADNTPALSGGTYSGVQLVIGGPSGILPEHPGRLLAAEKFQAYPTLGGSVKHGGSFMLRDIFIDTFNETILDDSMTGKQYIESIIEQTNGADPTGAWLKFAEEEIFSAEDLRNGSFKRLTPGLLDLCSTISLKNPVLLVLQANAKKLPNSTYLYTFDYESDLNRYATPPDEVVDVPFDMGVSLTDDNLYLFPWPRFNVLNSNRDIKIANRMVDLWTSFATSGVPAAKNMPAWPALSDEAGPYLRIGRTVSIGDNYLDEYSIAVQEAKQGYSIVNEDYYDLAAVLRDFDQQDQS
ncbi:glutactin [Scaptodrosophila lebanonensis]|uniref:Glutactin n=1 Tax=Drosophila lebanonensis TaxID=7225 RepID=A0A6J2TPX7_DROLE|nr:glutactin [Scaptodrosophila lebanonensis]